jgi:serine/threonine-protein kinase
MAEIDWSGICRDALGNFALTALPPTLTLPALPHAVTQFTEKSARPDVQFKDLAQIIETDTGLTLELLRHVNSAFCGLRTKAKTAQQALSLLGLRQSRTLLITTGMKAAVQAKQSKLINQACFWNASLQKALFARAVARLLKTDAELAFAGALLQDYLIPVVTNDLDAAYLEFIQTRDRQPANICEFEQHKFGWDHALAGACLALRWKLPEDLVCCILFHHQGLRILTNPQLGRTAAAAVAIAALLPDQLRQCYQGLEQLLLLETKWPAFRLEELAEQVDREHAEIGMGVRNDFPLARRCRSAVGTSSATTCQDGILTAAALAASKSTASARTSA